MKTSERLNLVGKEILDNTGTSSFICICLKDQIPINERSYTNDKAIQAVHKHIKHDAYKGITTYTSYLVDELGYNSQGDSGTTRVYRPTHDNAEFIRFLRSKLCFFLASQFEAQGD
jgi:hypothetical protein